EGTVVMPNAVINSRTTIGKHCIINSGAIIEHDNIINDFAHISVGVKLGGTVSVGRKAWIGIGATVKNNLSICDNCMIGAGATVVSSIIEIGTYIGVPAKRFN
ncbi:MAG: sialic acid O-acetyltransferase NeuD family sugar O-acyltransferase, partial [Lachnospiraceae bacterium]|nr:sialic acid O-acetyltransferase NeuD family sugar O-acyltransferase [Lachnospiraceae bacterium]